MQMPIDRWYCINTHGLLSLRGCICILSIFLMTMVSIYSPTFGEFLVYIGLLSLLSLMIFKKQINFDIGAVGYSSLLVAVLTAGVVLSIFFRTVTVLDLRSAIATLVMIWSIPFVYGVVSDNKSRVVRALNAVVVFHASFIFLQVGYWLITHQYLDFFLLITGEPSRSFSSFGIEAYGMIVPRFTGLFVEPGTFSVVVMSMVAAIYSCRNRITWPVAIGALATLCTMSVYGIALIILLATIHVFRWRRRFFVVAIALTGLVIAGVLFDYLGGYSAVSDRLFSTDSGLGFRRQMLGFLFSSGDRALLGVSLSDHPGYVVMNDIGVWFALWMSFGVAGITLVLATLIFAWKRTKSLLTVGLVVLVVLTKLENTYPLFWFLIVCIIVFSSNRTSNAIQKYSVMAQ